MVVPMDVAECAPPESRGLLIGLQQFAVELSMMVSFWIVGQSLFSLGSKLITTRITVQILSVELAQGNLTHHGYSRSLSSYFQLSHC